MKDRKLIKVTFEFDNGDIQILDEKAQEWIDDINNMCVIMKLHDMNPFDEHKYNWKN